MKNQRHIYIAIIILSILIIILLGGCSFSNKNNRKTIDYGLNTTEDSTKTDTDKTPTEVNQDFEELVQKPRGIVDLMAGKQKEMNVFISHFTEAHLPDFKGEPPNDLLIDFAVRYNSIQNANDVEVKGNQGYLHKSKIERATQKYFGLDVEHQKTDNYDFDGDYYIIDLTDEDILPMAVVYIIYDNNDGTYSAYFEEAYSSDGVLDYYTTPEKLEEIIKKSPDTIWVGPLKEAILTTHEFEGELQYKLKRYITVP